MYQGSCDKYGEDGVNLEILLHEVDLSSKASPIPPNAVRCMTVHGAKGMEFGHVYLIRIADGVLPSFQAIKKGPTSQDVEEERQNRVAAQ